MTAAVILLWAGCLYALARSILLLLWMASPWRRILTLAVLLLAVRCAHKPRETPAANPENQPKSSCVPPLSCGKMTTEKESERHA